MPPLLEKRWRRFLLEQTSDCRSGTGADDDRSKPNICFARSTAIAADDLGLLAESTWAPSGPTHDYLGLHLDWIYTRDIEILGVAIEPMKFSDHHAVRVTLAPCSASSRAQASYSAESAHH
jgi:hypothetical protein